MNDQLISIETAKLANSKGFPCYIKVNDFPTQSLLQKWLREKHGINVEVFLSYEFPYNTYFYRVMKIGKYFTLSHTDFESNIYEEALEAGLQEALKLIE